LSREVKETDVASSTKSPPTPLLHRLQFGLTALLLVGLLAFATLAAAGRVHFGRLPRPAAPEGNAAKPAETASKGKEKDTPKSKSDDQPAGRYQIEVVDDARFVIGEAGKLGVLGQPIREAWVFRYRGGFAECKLETDFDGKTHSTGTVPEEWSRFLTQDDEIRQGKPEAVRKEGYILLLSMSEMESVPDALKPLHAHLGALFTVGPAGPLHTLVPFYREVWRKREYRLFLSAGPPRGQTGQGFNLWTGDLLMVRSHFLEDEAFNDPARTIGGKDLEPGKDLVILDCSRGLSKIRLKARFLTDQEVCEKARAVAP
jgi:hypothetical protein